MDKMHKVMGEYKRGTLRSGTGKPGQKRGKVKKRSQAIAIGMSEAGKSREKRLEGKEL